MPWGPLFSVGFVVLIVIVFAVVAMFMKLFQKVEQGTALVVNGMGGTKVTFSGMVVLPVIHRAERMDISVKRIEIYRHGSEGLICKDNIRADIKVVFFVRVNKTVQDVMQVAQLLGCDRASKESALVELYDAKFSEALKTVGKQFDFVDLYNSRERFKEEILNIIGTDLNGYVLDDAAIDYLEQTPVEKLNPDNILDADGIKKITDLTAKQQMLANDIRREKEKVITKQDVEAREAILELERQQKEAEAKQAREVAEVQAREKAESEVVEHEAKLKSEQARISTEEEVQIAEQNKQRQVLVAEKNKARTNAVETERVEKDRALEATERERVVTLAQIEKEKSVEVEKKSIQDVIRERVVVERAVVEEQEKIKDTEEFAAADRAKQVAVTLAAKEAEESLVKRVKAAEAEKEAATLTAQKVIVEAEAERKAAEEKTESKKMLAEATAAEAAAAGLGEATVMQAKADATEKQGVVDALILQRKAEAEALGLQAKAKATEEQGTAEAKVMELKFTADAQGISQKAEAMKLLDGVGREHEEFKLQLEKEKDVEIAQIKSRVKVAAEQARLVGEGLKSANIDIVGGENDFFEKIVKSISNGKAVDRMVGNSEVLKDVKSTFFNGNGADFEAKLKELVTRFNVDSNDIKNLSIAALLGRMIAKADDDGSKDELRGLLKLAQQSGVAKSTVSALQLAAPALSS